MTLHKRMHNKYIENAPIALINDVRTGRRIMTIVSTHAQQIKNRKCSNTTGKWCTHRKENHDDCINAKDACTKKSICELIFLRCETHFHRRIECGVDVLHSSILRYFRSFCRLVYLRAAGEVSFYSFITLLSSLRAAGEVSFYPS